MDLKNLLKQPIQHLYEKPDSNFTNDLRENAGLVTLESGDRMIVENSYFKKGLGGSLPNVFTRKAVKTRLERVLKRLPSNLGLVVFDIFRSRECQQSLYDDFFNIVSGRHPEWDSQRVREEVLQFVADPAGKGRYPIPPHNTGGAIDLAIWDFETDQMLDFGTEFDAISEQSRTDFFEKEAENVGVQENRRLLYHLMVEQGFTNYKNEWWHFDLGNCPWAIAHKISWVFDSLESEIFK